MLAGITTANDLDNTTLLPLCCDPGDKHRRKVWDAFNHRAGRCSRWSSLRALAVPIRACPNLDTLKPYRLPESIQTRREPTNQCRIYRDVVIDPEDNGVEPIDPRRRPTFRVTVA
jgi:hypothetical protein